MNKRISDQIKFVLLKLEGGAKLVVDQGGKTKYGFSSKGNPDLDIENLTYEQAEQLAYDRYYVPSGAEKYNNHMGMDLIIFDTAFHSGPAKAKELLKYGTEPSVYLLHRVFFLGGLAIKKPEIYADDLPGWTGTRLRRLYEESKKYY